jgi:hypothetical protein
MTDEVRRELLRLLSALFDGRWSDARHARLEELLDADAECRRLYLEYVDLHARLLTHPRLAPDAARPAAPATVGPDAPRATPALSDRRRRTLALLRYGLVAAATLAASVLAQVIWRPRAEVRRDDPTPPAVAAPAAVATLAQAVDCIWDDAGEPRRAGARLRPGELRLTKGLARVRVDSGPDLVIEGPATVRLDSATSATVLGGKVVFRGDEAAVSFDLHTPSSTLLDRGTEYAVVVDGDGEEVHVFDGEVERRSRRGKSDHLKEGDARRYGLEPQGAGQPPKYDRARFVRELPFVARPVPDDSGLLAYEGFDYRDADAIAAGKADGGRGWVGPWQLEFARPLNPGDLNRLTLNVGRGLVRAGAPAGSVGGAFEYTGFTKCYRRLANPLRMDAEGVLYLSCLFCRHAPSDHPTNAVAVLFRTTEELQPDKNDPNKRLNVGVGGANEMFTHLNRVGSRTAVPLDYGETYLLVAKIVTGTAGPNQVFIRVYAQQEPVERDEPVNWTVVGQPFQSELVFDWLEVHINSKARQTIDELRLGTNWAAVTAPLAAAGPRRDIKP